MADLPSFKDKLNDLEVAQNKPVTEALMTKIGSNINALIDHDDADDVEIAQIQADLTTLTARVDDADNVVTLFNQSVFMFSDLGWALGNEGPGICHVKEKVSNVFSSYKLIQYDEIPSQYLNNPVLHPMPSVINTYDTGITASQPTFYTLTWEPTATQWVFTFKIYEAVGV